MAAVNGSSGSNGVNGHTKENASRHVDSTNPEFTQHCINAIGPNASPRARELGAALFKHIHAFAREVQLTTVRPLTRLRENVPADLASQDEWMAGQELLNQCGKLWTESEGKRNEMHRMSDVLGLESYAHLSNLSIPILLQTRSLCKQGPF